MNDIIALRNKVARLEREAKRDIVPFIDKIRSDLFNVAHIYKISDPAGFTALTSRYYSIDFYRLTENSNFCIWKIFKVDKTIFEYEDGYQVVSRYLPDEIDIEHIKKITEQVSEYAHNYAKSKRDKEDAKERKLIKENWGIE